MALWANGKIIRPWLCAHRLFHPDRSTDDRRCQLCGFSSTHPASGVLGPDRQPVWRAVGQLARPTGNRALGDYHRDHLERGGILYDLLPRRSCRRSPRTLKKPPISKVPAAGPIRAASFASVDADDIVHCVNAHDQLGQADRPPCSS